MQKKIFWGAVIALFFIMAGCAGSGKQIYHSNPATQTVTTQQFEATLEPMLAEGYSYYNQFRFAFTNKTDGDLIVDWSETYYLQNGKRYGRFGWEGLTFEELREVRQAPDLTVAAGQSQTSVIFPLKLIGWKEKAVNLTSSKPEAGFTKGLIQAGKTGMSIAVIKDGEVTRKNIVVTVTQE